MGTLLNFIRKTNDCLLYTSGPFQYGDVTITKDQYTAAMEGGYYDGGLSLIHIWDYRRSVGNYEKATDNLKQELNDLNDTLIRMAQAGDTSSASFKEMVKRCLLYTS